MYGTKNAAQCFDVASENAMTAMGYDTGTCLPCLFCTFRAQLTCLCSDTVMTLWCQCLAGVVPVHTTWSGCRVATCRPGSGCRSAWLAGCNEMKRQPVDRRGLMRPGVRTGVECASQFNPWPCPRMLGSVQAPMKRSQFNAVASSRETLRRHTFLTVVATCSRDVGGASPIRVVYQRLRCT